MKLRNKITKEICDAEAREDGIYVKNNWGNGEEWQKYGLECLGDNWEYYVEPKEPLIKDEKIRKAVRAWAEANRVTEVRYSSCHDAECEFNARDDENKSIVFIGNFTKMNEKLDLSGRTIYPIDELCGEEEE